MRSLRKKTSFRSAPLRGTAARIDLDQLAGSFQRGCERVEAGLDQGS
jgi:hypothetical protein